MKNKPIGPVMIGNLPALSSSRLNWKRKDATNLWKQSWVRKILVKRLIGYSPEDVNWGSMRLSSKERHSRRAVANTIIVLLIIFWAFPVAVVGIISNVNFLTDKVPFLRFINNMPTFLMGVITGLVAYYCVGRFDVPSPTFYRNVGET